MEAKIFKRKDVATWHYHRKRFTPSKISTLFLKGKERSLIDGQIYMMAPPNRNHQKISGSLYAEIYNYIQKKNGNCEVYSAPFAVFLNTDDINYVEPDISIICDKNKLTDKGCNGAPDWLIEIVSPSTQQMDYGIKLFKYRAAGVREYWIVNPKTQAVDVFDFEHAKGSNQYNFHDDIPVCIYKDLSINISQLLSN